LFENMPPQPSPEPNEITSRFEKLLVALVTDKVDFAVAGGFAVILNGYPRMTQDVDILVDDAPENLQRLLNSLSPDLAETGLLARQRPARCRRPEGDSRASGVSATIGKRVTEI
jgi:hypothetical protein